jgi:hypothetical protein
MQNFPPTTHSVPESFLTKFGSYITAVLSGFDRIRFRGVLRLLFKPLEMDFYLSRCGVLIKDFKAFAEELTRRVRAAAYRFPNSGLFSMQVPQGRAKMRKEIGRKHRFFGERISSQLTGSSAKPGTKATSIVG